MYHTIQPNNTTMNDTQVDCRLTGVENNIMKPQPNKKDKVLEFKKRKKRQGKLAENERHRNRGMGEGRREKE